MANHPSAIKRHRQSLKKQASNKAVKSRIGTLTRRVNEAVAAGDVEAAQTALTDVSRGLAKAASKGTLHRSTASRRTSRLATKVAKLATS